MTSPLFHQAKEKQIGDCKYRVEPLGFIDGRKAFVRLSNMIGPAIASLDGGATTEEGAVASFARAAGTLLGGLKDEDLGYFHALFAPRTTLVLPDGREPLLSDQPEHFAGKRFADYLPWLVFCVEATFGDFFGDVARKLTARFSRDVAKGSPSASRPASTGSTGG